MCHALCYVWRAACVLALLIATGCANPQPTRFYLLTPLPAERPGSAAGPAVGLRPVQLPEELDRPQILTRTGENTVKLAEFDRWASPLVDNFTRVLAQDLAVLIPAERVAVFPWAKNTPIDYEVTVDVVQADGSLRGDCMLVAYWTIAKRGAREVVARGKFTQTEPAGASYAALVSAKSRLVAALGRDIATALKTLTR